MYNRTIHLICLSAAVAGIATVLGCEVREYNPAPPPPPPVAVVTDDPGVVAIDVEPPPPERVYVYDPGYPPGTYLYGGYYYYNGYRYPHDVFVHRYVDVNIRDHRYVDRDDNRRIGGPIVERQRTEYVQRGNHQVPVTVHHPEEHHDYHAPY